MFLVIFLIGMKKYHYVKCRALAGWVYSAGGAGKCIALRPDGLAFRVARRLGKQAFGGVGGASRHEKADADIFLRGRRFDDRTLFLCKGYQNGLVAPRFGASRSGTPRWFFGSTALHKYALTCAQI